MSLLNRGQSFEKLNEVQKAIGEYKKGQALVLNTFSAEHQFYEVFSGAIIAVKGQ